MPKDGRTANKLEDVDVDRLDAVDDPASGRKWLVVKFTDDHQPQERPMNAEHLEKSALAMVEAFKAEAETGMLRVGEKSAGAISEVMKALGIDGAMKATEEPPPPADPPADAPPADAPPADPPADPPPQGAEKKKQDEPKDDDDDKDKDKLPEAFKAVSELTEAVKSLQTQVATLAEKQKEPAMKSTEPPPKSTQPPGTERKEVQKAAPKKMGEGVFASFFESKV